MDFRMLGPLEAVADGRVVALDAAKHRALLAILLAARERARGERPADRRSLGRPSAGHRGEGPADVRLPAPQGARQRGDRHQAGGLRAPRRAGRSRSSPLRALVMRRGGRSRRLRRESLREALALWRGPPLVEFAYEPWAQGEIGSTRGASPLHAPGSDRRRSRARPRRRAGRRARAPGRRAPALGATARPAHARPLPLGQAGGGSGGLPGGAGASWSSSSGSSRGRRCATSSARSSIKIRHWTSPLWARRARCPDSRHRACERDRPLSSAASGSCARFARS